MFILYILSHLCSFVIYSSVFFYLSKSGSTVTELPLKISQIIKSKEVFTWTSSSVGIYFGLICFTTLGEWSEKLVILSHPIKRETKTLLTRWHAFFRASPKLHAFLFGFSSVHLIACSFNDWPVCFCRWFSFYDTQAKIAFTGPNRPGISELPCDSHSKRVVVQDQWVWLD